MILLIRFRIPIKDDQVKPLYNSDNEEMGLAIFTVSGDNFRNAAGYFLFKENNYYLELLYLSYASAKEKEVFAILSTIKKE